MRSLPLLVVLIAWLPMPAQEGPAQEGPAQEGPAQERWFDVPVAEVTPLGEWPTGETDWRRWALARQIRPYAVLEGPGEAVVAVEDAGGFADPTAMRQARLLVRTTANGEVRGRVAVRKPDGSGLVMLPFVLAAGQARPDAEARFLRAQQQVLRDLVSARAAGAAWFRHRLDASQRAAGQTVDPVDQATADARRRDGLDDTFQLFTGDRALVENLQFDRPLAVIEAGAPTVALSTIDGITVAAIDWAPLIGDARPEPDPLAARIPADQHAVFFPGFAALIAAIDEIDRTGTPVLAAFEPHSEDALTRESYQRQLCIGLSDLGRRFGAQLVDSVAMTGSDPFLRAGSDVAVLFQAKQPQVLAAYVMAQQATAAKARPDAVTTDSDIGGLAVHAVTTPDRSLCSYLAVLDDCVVVANSPAQLARLAAVRGGGAALATTGEYRFFRDRYRRGADDEVALVVVPDDAIRRWCGPRWRIADSRRTRAAAILTEIDLRHA
ncbi:MAG: hypothetical protein H0W72_06345, partial [Planctomycetes bacterium]|nr:hypothetical protein [Planctomycetota bacterium]